MKIVKLFVIATFLMAFQVLSAMSLGEAKGKSLVREDCNGYLLLTKNGSRDNSAKALVSKINNERKSHYKKIAKKEAVSVNVVANRTGKKLCNK